MLMLATAAVADDTDIYLGKDGTGGASAPSNIMLLLDTSGSMTGKVDERYEDNDPYEPHYKSYSPGNKMSKVDAMIKAALDLLNPDEVPAENPGDDPIKPLKDVNIGIAVFEQNTGNIEHPIELVNDARDSLRQTIIDKVNTKWATPIVGSYYETIKYFRGMTRDANSKSVASTLNGDQYISPGFVEGGECGGENVIVILSDGQPTVAHPNGAFDNDPEFQAFATAGGANFCASENGSGRCGVELAKFIAETDLDPSTPMKETITTHTIAFGATEGAKDYLKEIAGASVSGQFFEASSASALRDVFAQIVGSVAKTPGAFSAPSVPADTSNGLVSGSDVYLNLFQSDKRQLWVGNVKKFGLRTSCEGIAGGCETGELLGTTANNPTVPLLDGDNQFDVTVGDYWSTGEFNSAEVMSGGLGNLLEDYTQRNVYSWIYDDQDDIEFFKIDRAAEAAGTWGGQNAAILGPYLADTYDHCAAESGDAKAACMGELVEFMLGKKNDVWPEQPGTNNRWAMAEVMHSKIITINYGKTSNGTPIQKLIFGTNDGGLHLHDAVTGAEHFTVYPPETLESLPDMMKYAESTAHIYGLDGVPTVRIRDVNGNGIIEPTGNPATSDFVHAYIGMRRGGFSYYAFDLTPASDATSPDVTITPDLMWTIDGSGDASSPYGRFGQTWSKPQLAKIKLQQGATTETKTVLIFGGGYDDVNEDGDLNFDPATKKLGNAIYIVDADSGDLLWWAGSDVGSTQSTVPGYQVDDMLSGIAADIRMVDTDGDRAIDRLYAVDLTGNVWRADLGTDLDDSVVSKFASLSEYGGADPAADRPDERKFFYRPSFVRVQDGTFSGGPNGGDVYDLVTVVSGNRANPLGKATSDRVYALRDYEIENRTTNSAGNNFPACNPNATNCPSDSIEEDHLLDVSNLIFNAGVNPASPTGDPDELRSRHGWFFDLTLEGEKGFSETKISAGKLSFSSYVPAPEDDTLQCGVAVGTSFVYSVDVLTGSPANLGWDTDDSSASITDRGRYAGDGPTTSGTAVVTEDGTSDLCQSGGDGRCPSDESDNAPFRQTFWYQD